MNTSENKDRIADYDSPVVLTHMIDNKKFEKQELWDKLDFDRSKHYFHIQPHEESHARRRNAIMEKYGKQVKALLKPDIRSIYLATFVIILQLFMAWFTSQQTGIVFFLIMYIIGATANHTSQILIHDLTHYNGVENYNINRVFACLACVPTGLPSAITFGKYHYEHHVHMGHPDYDADLPTELEIKFFKKTWTKLLFVFLHPIFYVFRPLATKPKMINKWEIINWVIVLSTDYLIYQYLGGWALTYLLLSTFFSMGLHPTAAHTIGEHYEFVKGQESYNYYGFWNFFNVNLGYHIEHHDFPTIAMWNLPKLHKIAPEFYENIPYHTSYCKVLWKFITDDNLGSFARIDITESKVTKKPKSQ